jgi:hypothetical protein
MAEYDWKQTQADSQASFPLRGFSQLAANMVMTQPGVLGAGRSRRATTRGIGLLDELCASSETRIAEYLRFRERFIDQTRRAGLFIVSAFRASASRTLCLTLRPRCRCTHECSYSAIHAKAPLTRKCAADALV